MARRNLEETVGGRLNNKAHVDNNEDLVGVRRSRTEKIGKNSYCHRSSRHHHHREHQKKRDVGRRSMFQRVVPFFSAFGLRRVATSSPYFTMILLPIYLGLLSQVGIFAGGVEGIGEIESCIVQTRSSSTGGASSSSSGGVGGSNGLGYYSGSSSPAQNNGAGGINGAGASGSSGVSGANNGLLGGDGGNNNNEAAAAPAVGGPHSVVICQIRVLHTDLDMENLTSTILSAGGTGTVTTTSMDTKSITRLKLVCNDVLFFESAVSSGQLRSFSELHDLTIDKCKLTNLPEGFLSGLRHLRKLTINTFNSLWGARSLELHAESLSDVPLRHLNLGFNHMWSLPSSLICKLDSLQSLNMTHNLLSDIEDLGLPGRPILGSINRNSGESDQTSSSSVVSSGDGPSSCLAELKSLDLSSNSLRTLGSRRLEHLKRLQDFRLDHNWLEELEDDALHGLGQLRLLNLSSNRLVALPSKLFQPCRLLRDMDLRNNSLAALSPGLLNGLEHLQVLDLSMNFLTSQWIKDDSFKSLVRLVILNLSHNQLTHLAPSTFHDLYTLQVLDLGNNLISSIADGTFAPMSNLHSLNLARNRLVTISPHTFRGLYVLSRLILDYNQISSFHTGSMQNLTSLEDLGLVGNQLSRLPAFNFLNNLRTLDIGENKISALNNESFLGMSQLIGLRLVDNLLEEIPKGLCDPVNRLRVFNVAQNKINKVSSQAFISCPELRVLRLDSNRLEAIPPTLAPQLHNLLWLNISENSIRTADYTLLPPTLEWLDISHNQLESIGGAWSNYNTVGAAASGSNIDDGNIFSAASVGNDGNNNNNVLISNNGNGLALPRTAPHQHNNHHHSHSQVFADHPNAKLRVVDISHNKLTKLDHHAIPPHIEVLRLSHNRLKKIDPDTFARSSNLRRVEVIGNQLENIPLTALRIPTVTPGKPLPEFFLGGNPFLCDCSMEWLTRINQLSSLRKYPAVLDLDTIICRLAFSPSVTHVPLTDIKSSDFLCVYSSHCFASCHCCAFEFCDCRMTCPSPDPPGEGEKNNSTRSCTCYHDQTWSANVVNCAGTGHTAIPSRLPMDSTEIYLDGNAISSLKSHTFIGRKNLRTLFFNASQLETISNKSFNGLHSLQTLYLHENKLKVLHGYEFDQLNRLRELYLHDNLIESISNTTFLPLKSLEILRLDGNRLVVYTVWQLSLNPYLVEIGLARNKWNCDCQFLHQLYGWVSDNSRKVVDLVQLQCVWNTTHKPGPHLIDYNRTCGSSWALMGIENGYDFTTLSPLPIALAFVSLVTLLILVVALVIVCRENLSLWLFTKFNGFRLCAAADYEDDKSYDSYIIYSQKDEEFVAQRIADELETNDNYRLCLHYRDLICETGDLKEMMIGAVENSKSVLIILSRNFLQGEWSSGEYRNAFHAVLKKSQRRRSGFGGNGSSKTPPKKILIVFIEDIPKVEISPDIRTWVSHNRIKVIKWNIQSTDYRKNRKFWNKLKFAMPNPSQIYNSNITTTTTSASSNEAHGGIIATLKYSTTLKGDNHISHPQIHSNIQHHSLHHQAAHHHPHQQIIVDESGRFITTSAPPQISSSQNNTLNSIKYWPYGATNFVALPPKYQASHHSSSAGSHPPSVNSPGSAQSLHYHPPLPLSNPPKSPPSSQSTDSTTTTMADDVPSLMSQLTMASFHSANYGPSSGNNVSATKSPVPVPKSSYTSSPRNILSTNSVNSPLMLANVSNSSNNASSSSSTSSTTSNNITGGGVNMTGENNSYMEGEHIYSCLDPPSPQPVQQSMSLKSQNILGNGSANGVVGATNFLNNVHVPPGFTYQTQALNNHHHHSPQQPNWLGGANPQHHLTSSHGGGNNKHNNIHHHHPAAAAASNFVGSSSPSNVAGGGTTKSFNNKQQKDGNNPVQTYLV